ncbi:hypothetical protein PARA125_000382 [Parachlamydia sp. AcF125]|nr:hypothetical protein [Parachlamydia sp. AcF125]
MRNCLVPRCFEAEEKMDVAEQVLLNLIDWLKRREVSGFDKFSFNRRGEAVI